MEQVFDLVQQYPPLLGLACTPLMLAALWLVRKAAGAVVRLFTPAPPSEQARLLLQMIAESPTWVREVYSGKWICRASTRKIAFVSRDHILLPVESAQARMDFHSYRLEELVFEDRDRRLVARAIDNLLDAEQKKAALAAVQKAASGGGVSANVPAAAGTSVCPF